MTKESLWKLYTDRNPHWLTDGATLTPDGLKRLFDQTFDLAHKEGFENGKAARSGAGESIGDILRDVLGKGRREKP